MNGICGAAQTSKGHRGTVRLLAWSARYCSYLNCSSKPQTNVFTLSQVAIIKMTDWYWYSNQFHLSYLTVRD